MNQNLGKLDRILRFALAESFLGWCGLHRLFGIDNKNQ